MKQIFSILILSVLLLLGYLYKENTQLKQQLTSCQNQKNTIITTAIKDKNNIIAVNSKDINNCPKQEVVTQKQEQKQEQNQNQLQNQEIKYQEQTKMLEQMSNQLVQQRIKNNTLAQKLLIATSKKIILKDEIQQTDKAKKTIEKLKHQVKKTQQKLMQTKEQFTQVKTKLNTLNNKNAIALNNAQVKNKQNTIDEKPKITINDQLKINKLDSIVAVFKNNNKDSIIRNIKYIDRLQKASSGALLTGAIIPIVGAATLISYSIEESKNYCNSIKNILELEKSIFGKIISLDEKTKKAYHKACIDTIY